MPVSRLPRLLIVGLIRVYQKTLSRDHGPLRVFYPHGYCRFHPTCSEYTRQAVLKYGALKGLVLGVRRISKCHPWSAGGVDKVPE